MALLISLTLLTAILGALAAQYLARLPVAPQCPACRSVTGQPAHASGADRLLARLGGAAARQCPRCGWSGRMRWRLAPEHAGRK